MIVLVFGGRAQGKTEYLRKRFSLAPQDIAAQIGAQKAIVHLEKLVRQEGAASILAKLEQRFAAGDCFLSCDEVGMGIVPTDAAERRYRDEVGALLCALAQRADRVVRVFAGIGQVLK